MPHNTSTQDILRLKQINPTIFIAARLTGDFNQQAVSVDSFFNLIKPDTSRLYDLGIRYFEVHHERTCK
ncbi:MAG: hypothetical protein AB1345_01825 [Chloroflexota bacterium]